MAERTYAEARADLEDALRDLERLCDERSMGRIRDGAASLLKKLAEERFNVVVLGEFKRGKTTFVNALLGAEVLPAAVVPLTSIVTAVTWGDEARAEVSFRDGRTDTLPVEELATYVTKRDNPGNRLGVDGAVVFYPSEELRDGVHLVDTPGVGSVYGHNTEAAYAFVPESDAAVLLTSADPPISEGERRFLEDVRAEAARMFFVLNKIDYVSDRDRAEALAFTRQVLTRALGTEPRVYPISARRALRAKVEGDAGALDASGLPDFEGDFHRFLMHEKGDVILESVRGQARKLVADGRNEIDVSLRGLDLPLEQLTRTRDEMEAVFAEALRSRDDVRTLLRGEAAALVKLVEGDLAEFQRRAAAEVLELSLRFLDEADDVRAAVSNVDGFVKELLRRRVERWRIDDERKVGAAFREATARHVDETNRLIERTVRLCGELLRVELSSVNVPGGIAPETHLSHAFFEVPTILASLLPDMSKLLPAGTVRKRAEKDLRSRVDRRLASMFRLDAPSRVP